MSKDIALHEVAKTGEATNVAFAPSALRVLNYQHPELVERLKRKMSLSQDEAEELFADMKKFLLLCGLRQDQPLVPTKQVDEAWHHFILYTQDYAAFCEDMFGEFIHHVPNSYLTATRVEEAASVAQSFDATLATARNVFGTLGKNWAKPTSRCLPCLGGPRANKRRAGASPAGCMHRCFGFGPRKQADATALAAGCLAKCMCSVPHGPSKQASTSAVGGPGRCVLSRGAVTGSDHAVAASPADGGLEGSPACFANPTPAKPEAKSAARCMCMCLRNPRGAAA